MKHIICALTALVLLIAPARAAEESTYDRVMRTETLRCGYGLGAPLVSKDPNTGELSGIMVEVMDEIGTALSFDVEWTQEVPWGNMATALKAGKVDLICSSLWASAARGKHMAFTRPLFFSKIDAFARADDTRFDNSPSRINRPDIRISVQEGDIVEEIAKTSFPEAERAYISSLSSTEQLFLDIIHDKADVTFMNTVYARDFSKKRPGEIRRIPLENPVRLFANALAVDIREQELQDMLDIAVGQVVKNGAVGRILNKYEKDYPDVFLHVAKPYTAE